MIDLKRLSVIAFGLLCLSPVARADLAPDVMDAMAAALVRNHVLTEAQARCISYWPAEETAAYIEVEVHEEHGHGCPGDPDTSPRLFNVRYENQTHAVLKEDPVTGEFNRLR